MDLGNIIKEVIRAPITILGKVGGVISSDPNFQWGQTYLNNLATFGTFGIYPLYNKVSGGVSDAISTVKGYVNDAKTEATKIGSTISNGINTFTSGASDLEKKLGDGITKLGSVVSGGAITLEKAVSTGLGKIGGLADSLSGAVGGLGGSLSGVFVKFGNALSSLDLSKFGSVSLPSISIGGSDTGSLLPIALIGVAGLVGLFLLTRVI